VKRLESYFQPKVKKKRESLKPSCSGRFGRFWPSSQIKHSGKRSGAKVLEAHFQKKVKKNRVSSTLAVTAI
jgi:hypothetical protein